MYSRNQKNVTFTVPVLPFFLKTENGLKMERNRNGRCTIDLAIDIECPRAIAYTELPRPHPCTHSNQTSSDVPESNQS